MARFGARGVIAGHSAELWWEDGELTGPQWAVDYAKRLADDLTGTRLGRPNGPSTTRDYLDFWWSADGILGRVFGDSLEQLGEVPGFAPLPKGAIQ